MNETTRITVDLIIPAFNEEEAIRAVLRDIPKGILRNIVVVDNGSTDHTARNAAELGATVLVEERKGYGNACLKGMAYLENLPEGDPPEIVLFMDGDHSDYPEEMQRILDPIMEEQADLVIGSRALGTAEKGSMTFVQQFGNSLATYLIRVLYQTRFTDLGPFRAIRWQSLELLDMQDRNFGWTVEMQVKAAKLGLRCREVPVRYRKRIGKSKVSGTVTGSISAGYKIIYTILKNLV